MNWKPGDRAILVDLVQHSELNGVEVTILSELMLAALDGRMVYEIDVPPPPGKVWTSVEPRYLRPIYGGNEKISWEDCVWQPQKDLVSAEQLQDK